MTPCEKLGYQEGDIFEFVDEEGTFYKGSAVILAEDDGTSMPMFEGVGCKAKDGDDWAYSPLECVRAIRKTPDNLTTILESAAEHDAKAKHHAAEHERLMQQARDMLPDGWRLVKAEDMVQTVSEDPRDWIKGGIEDISDPAEWDEWEGGECPVEEGTLVDVRYRSGKEELALEAGRYNQGRESEMVAVDWSHSGSQNDIVAYRVCPT